MSAIYHLSIKSIDWVEHVATPQWNTNEALELQNSTNHLTTAKNI